MGVVNLRRTGPTSYTMPDHVMNAIRVKMHGVHVSDLADIAGVSKSTIYAIRSGRTTWPRGTTMFPVLEALGLEIRIYDRYEKEYL